MKIIVCHYMWCERAGKILDAVFHDLHVWVDFLPSPHVAFRNVAAFESISMKTKYQAEAAWYF